MYPIVEHLPHNSHWWYLILPYVTNNMLINKAKLMQHTVHLINKLHQTIRMALNKSLKMVAELSISATTTAIIVIYLV